MLANKHFNGQMTIADRGPWIVYGKAVKRAEPLTFKRFLPALAFAVGENFCRKHFSIEACEDWSPRPVDKAGLGKIEELKQQGLSSSQIDKKLLGMALEEIKRHPFQYILLSGVEGFKLFFWESTTIGFVKYPPGLKRLFAWGPFKNIIRFLMSLFTILSVCYLWYYLWRERKILQESFSPVKQRYIILFSIGVLIFIYMVFYSPFFVVPRHAFSIVSLYLIVMAFAVQNLFFRKDLP